MMHSEVTSLLIAPLKLREFRDPYETIFVLVKQIELFRKLHTERSQRIPYNFILISSEQKQIARLSVHRFDQCIHLLFAHKLRE